MKEYKNRLVFLFLMFGVLLFVFFDARLVFFLFNREHFQSASNSEIFWAFLNGIRFDVSAILFTQALWILIISFFWNSVQVKAVRIIAKVIFLLSTFLCLIANYSDVAYFGFIEKRSSYDVFRLVGEQVDFMVLLPEFIKDYWYLFVLVFINAFAIYYLYTHFEKRYLLSRNEERSTTRNYFFRFVLFLIVISFSVLGMRGGLQVVPLNLSHATESVSGPLIPLTLNSPFSIIKSYKLKGMRELNFVSDELAKLCFNPVKSASNSKTFNGKNVIVIILESFSLEYTSGGAKVSYTPFLDSLMSVSYNFSQAFANGKRSIEGIPSILASIPSFEEPYINSYYSGNKIESFASLLKKKGYHTSFFHGGKNGTMSFDVFCKVAGFDLYYGLSEYPNKADYDGRWGIWDRPFLANYVKELSKFKPPFFSSVFTLSSHHPFELPETEKGKFKGGNLEIHKTIQYSDDALRNFFRLASKEAWYKNTLFVITADHTGPTEDAYFSNAIGNYKIPLLFFTPSETIHRQDQKIVQQVDILPSVLHLLSYDRSFFSFGNNVFDSLQPRFAVNFQNGLYQYLEGDKIFQFNMGEIKSVYSILKDSLLKNPLSLKKYENDSGVIRYKSFLQTYQNSVIRNQTNSE